MTMPFRPGQKYQPSGRFGLSTVLLVPLLGVPTAAVAAAIYAYAILYIPFVYINALITVGFGFVVGFAVAKGVALGKARSGALAALLGLLVGAAALCLSWVFWIYALLRRSDVDVALLDLALDPAALWQAITFVNAEGAWSLKSFTPTGTVLWILWTIEALLIVGFPTFLAIGQALSPFCEQCQGWCTKEKGVFRGAEIPREELERHLRAQEVSYVAARGAAEPGATTHLRYDVDRCACNATITLTVTQVTVKLENGKPKESTTELVSNLVLSRDAAAALQRLGQEPPRFAAPGAAQG